MVKNSQKNFSEPTQKIYSIVLDDQAASKWTLVFQCQIFRYFPGFCIVISVEFCLNGFFLANIYWIHNKQKFSTTIFIYHGKTFKRQVLFLLAKSLLNTLFFRKTGLKMKWLREKSFLLFLTQHGLTFWANHSLPPIMPK